MTKLDTGPLFASEAQEMFSPGDRVYLVDGYGPVGEGAEGMYAGHLRERLAVVDFDTPSGEPFRVAVPFNHVRQVYR